MFFYHKLLSDRARSVEVEHHMKRFHSEYKNIIIVKLSINIELFLHQKGLYKRQ